MPRDLNEAFKWYKKAAEQGVDKAMISVSSMYLAGEGTEQNEAEAVRWLKAVPKDSELRPLADQLLEAIEAANSGK